LEIIEMKKTLIALAAVAATGASFAQVTMSGNIGFSWQQSPVKYTDGSHVQGLSINDGEVYISATEDLGSGWAASARGGFTMRGRGTGIFDRDGTVSLTTPLGILTVGAVRACGLLDSVKSGAVTGTVYSSNESVNDVPIDKCSLVDVVQFNTMIGKDITVGASYGEQNAPVDFNFNNLLSASTGTVVGANANTKLVLGYSADDKGNKFGGITFQTISAKYANGPMMATVEFANFNMASSANQNLGYLTTAGVTALGGKYDAMALDGLQRLRLVGTYDAGVAKLGVGYQNRSWGLADQYMASISVPYGNFQFGLDYMMRDAQGTINKPSLSATDMARAKILVKALYGISEGDKASSAVGIGANYNFSKTTAVNVSYITYTDAGSVASTAAGTGSSSLDTEYRVRLMKSF